MTWPPSWHDLGGSYPPPSPVELEPSLDPRRARALRTKREYSALVTGATAARNAGKDTPCAGRSSSRPPSLPIVNSPAGITNISAAMLTPSAMAAYRGLRLHDVQDTASADRSGIANGTLLTANSQPLIDGARVEAEGREGGEGLDDVLIRIVLPAGILALTGR